MLHASFLIPLLLALTTAEEKREDTVLRMACHLWDGSLVIGDVDPATKVKLATGTDKIDIQLRRIPAVFSSLSDHSFRPGRRQRRRSTSVTSVARPPLITNRK